MNQIRTYGIQILVIAFLLGMISFFPLTHAPRVLAPRIPEATAQSVELPYGGLNLFQLYCGCSLNWVIYVFDFTTMTVLPLLCQDGYSKFYEYYNVFGTYLTGSYLPGVQGCVIGAVPYCALWGTAGVMGHLPGTGTTGPFPAPVCGTIL